MRQIKIINMIALLAIVGATSGLAQDRPEQTSPADRHQWYADHVELTERSPFKNLAWQHLGPTNISGRMTDIAVVEPKGKHYTIYVAGASGGVWRTVNEGTTWEPIFQHAASTSIGDVTLAPSDPNTIWVGTGEANIFRSSMAGAGVYKSTDAGETWSYMGLGGTHTIPRIVVHPTNPDIVYVAASGHEWTDNEDRGLYKSTDGGESWTKILYKGLRTGVIDLVMHPRDPNTLYVSTWQRVREKWNDPRNKPFYNGSAIYKSTDAGSTWMEVTSGLPDAVHRGRIGIDIAASNPDVVYAFVDNYETLREADEGETDAYGRPRGPAIKGATVFRSDDGGENWRQMSDSNRYMERLSGTYGWVFGQMRVDPNDENKIYVMGLALNVSEDGGKTFRRLPGMHGDHHGLWIDPENSDYLVDVNDGGVAISYDAGDNWRTFYDDLSLVQFFNVSLDMDEPFRAYGSIQDYGSRRGVVDLSRGRHRIPAVSWGSAPGGEGSRQAIDPTDPDIVYSAGFYGTISRTDMSTGNRTAIMPERVDEDYSLRGQWLAPFIISPHNPRIIYLGMNYLFRSMDRGDEWKVLSPDLTYNNLDELGDIRYQTLFSIAESPFQFGLLYVGTDDGRVHITRDHGESWTELTDHLPYKKWISRIVASAFDEGTVYLAQNGKRDDDFTPYLYKSSDFGQTWESISDGIPSGPINVVREDPKNEDVLYVGTDIGVYVSLDAGENWHALASDLPSTFVSDLKVHPRDDILVASTHGRGMYALDVRILQKMTADVMAEDLHVFEADPARIQQHSARIYYFLKQSGDVSVSIQQEDGRELTSINGTGDAGLNYANWDMTIDDGDEPSDAEPGTYRVVISGERSSAEVALELVR
ncbi:MAG: hypothetical protein BMS9Abin05_1567 [Rhodothermia bacterium]|nr:MAG: hypothetical protein BMS9Abin05_1567 [Rhodothermia bacterium]